jgi:uncharacterized protein YqgV (UPF0045/DUF77 family)
MKEDFFAKLEKLIAEAKRLRISGFEEQLHPVGANLEDQAMEELMGVVPVFG